MANIYFGPEEPQLGPMPSPGQADWNTVNPPEVIAAAQVWDDKRKEFEQQQALESSMGRFVTMGNRAEWVPYQDMADTQKAIAAARQFQGTRMYAQAIANGMTEREAIARFGGDMFASNPAAFVKAMQPGKPAPTPRTWQERTINGNTVLTSEGNIRVIPPARDRELESLEAEENRLKTTTQAAAREAEALRGATQPEVIPAYQPGWFKQALGKVGLADATPRPAVTNQVPIVEPEKIAIAQGRASAASNQLAQASEAVKAHLASRRGPVTATNVAPVAPAPVSSMPLTKEALREFYRQSGGDKAKAMQLAKQAGYTF